MKFVIKIIVALGVNALALYCAMKWISGFSIQEAPQNIFLLALLLTVLNAFVKPILKIVLSPLIIITLGLALVVVNMIVLKLLDFLSGSLMIETVSALFYATLIVSLANAIFHAVAHRS